MSLKLSKSRKILCCAVGTLALCAFVTTSHVVLADPPAHAKGGKGGGKGNGKGKGKGKSKSGASYGAIHHRGRLRMAIGATRAGAAAMAVA